MSTTGSENIRTKLTNALNPDLLDIIDQSAQHAGHEGAASGGGHYTIHIVSDKFEGKSLIQRHRMIYDVMGDDMEHEIHALSIKSQTPEEHAATSA